MFCPHCGFEDERDEPNYHGKKCPECGEIVLPTKQITLASENQIKLMLLQAKVREIIRKKIQQ